MTEQNKSEPTKAPFPLTSGEMLAAAIAIRFGALLAASQSLYHGPMWETATVVRDKLLERLQAADPALTLDQPPMPPFTDYAEEHA